RSAVRAGRPDRCARQHAPLVRHERSALLRRDPPVHEQGRLGRELHRNRHRREIPAHDSAPVGARGLMSYIDESLAPGETIVARFDLHWTAKWRLIVFLLLAIPTLGIALLAALYEWIR